MTKEIRGIILPKIGKRGRARRLDTNVVMIVEWLHGTIAILYAFGDSATSEKCF